MHWYWYGWMEATRGNTITARPLLTQALQLHRQSQSPMGMAWALSIMHILERESGNYQTAYAYRYESLEYSQITRCSRGIAITHENLREIADSLYDHERGLMHSQLQLEVSLAAGLTVLGIRAYAALCQTSLLIGKYQETRGYADAGLELARTTCANEEELSRCEMLCVYGETMLLFGELKRAEQVLREVLAIDQKLGEQRMVLLDLMPLADLMLIQGDWQHVQKYCADALIVAETIGLWGWTPRIYRTRGRAALRAGDLTSACADLRESLHRFGDRNERHIRGGLANAFAELALVLGNAELATQLWGYQRAILEQTRMTFAPIWVPQRAQYLADCLSRLGDDLFEQNLHTGQMLTWDQVVAQVEVLLNAHNMLK